MEGFTLSEAVHSNTTDSPYLQTMEPDVIIQENMFVKSMYVFVGAFGVPGNLISIVIILSSVTLRSKPGMWNKVTERLFISSYGS